MEEKRYLLFVGIVGIVLGVWLGLTESLVFLVTNLVVLQEWVGVKRSPSSGEISGKQIERELKEMVVDGKEIQVKFPKYFSEKTRVLLTSAAYINLKSFHFSKHARNLLPASKAILLSGTQEPFQQKLAKALANHLQSKLLLLDISEFSLKIQRKYDCSRKETTTERSLSEVTKELMSSLLGSFSLPLSSVKTRGFEESTSYKQGSVIGSELRSTEDSFNPPKLHRFILSNAIEMSRTRALQRPASWYFDMKLFLESLYKVLLSVSETGSIILYVRDVDKHLLSSERLYNLFDKMLKKLSGPILILGSRVLDPADDFAEVDGRLSTLFPYNIEIELPKDSTHFASWMADLQNEMNMFELKDNRNRIAGVLADNDIECVDLDSICDVDLKILSKHIEESLVSAIGDHLMNNEDPEFRNGKLILSSKSLYDGFMSLFQEGQTGGKDIPRRLTKQEKMKDVLTLGTSESNMDTREENTGAKNKNKNEAEKSVPATTRRFKIFDGILHAVNDGDRESSVSKKAVDVEFENCTILTCPDQIGVTFEDIGAPDEVKESLKEQVMFPLERPDLFQGRLLKPCRSILLFGPPCTGKTMLAKAIAKEAGARLINVSRLFGDYSKDLRVLFSIAAKVAPTIIFVKEVDSILGQQTSNKAIQYVKNEFMTLWDELLTKPGQQILILATTNRPFDIDQSVIPRFECRIMVGLPSAENREMILKKFLMGEKTESIDFKELAAMTVGYTGCDLKNLCIAAAQRPLQELIKQERLRDMEKKKTEAERQSSSGDTSDGEEEYEQKCLNTPRPINMEDMRQAKNKVASSSATQGSLIEQLEEWNDMYGGGSRKEKSLSYFL